MRVPTSRQPRHEDRWEAIVRYALGSNARTIRLCLICVAVIGSQVLAVTVASLLPHILARL